MDTSNFNEVKLYLESINVCQRCILRFLGVKEYTSYSSKSSVSDALKKVLNIPLEKKEDDNSDDVEYPFPKRRPASSCVSCLGILQDSCDNMVVEVYEEVIASTHMFDDFVLQLSLPVVIDLRHQLFLLHLKEKFQDFYKFVESDIPSVKDVFKWVVGSEFGKITNSDFKPYSDFQIIISVFYLHYTTECLPLLKTYPEAFPNRNKKRAALEDILTRTAVLKALESASDIQSIFPFPPPVPSSKCMSDIVCHHSPIYFGGRYNKYSRELPQTAWFVDGERKMNTSVSELITDVVERVVYCDKIVFSSSGREDVDVKMLGNGRPFVLEIRNPRKVKWDSDKMKQMENEINDFSNNLIAVRSLQAITKKDTLLLKEGEEGKRKCYSALCILGRTLHEDDITKLNSLKDIKLSQKTPIRVLHRRTLSTRERIIHSLKAEILADNKLKLFMETQAGTYVKEFVHGDFGRTVPNLGTILNTTADILELDVESIEMEWPPQQS